MGHSSSTGDADSDFNRSVRDNLLDASDSASASHVDDVMDSEDDSNDVEVSTRGSVGVVAATSSRTTHNLSFDSVSVTVGRARGEVTPPSHGFLQRLDSAAEGAESATLAEHHHATVGVTGAKRAVLTQLDHHTISYDRSPSSRHSSQSSYSSVTESLAIPPAGETGFGVPPPLETTAGVAGGSRNLQVPSESLWAAQSRKREKEKPQGDPLRGEGKADSTQRTDVYAGKEMQRMHVASGEMHRSSSSSSSISNKAVETRQGQTLGAVQQGQTAGAVQQYPYNTANPGISVQSQPKQQQYPYNTASTSTSSGANAHTGVHSQSAQQGGVPAGMYNNNSSRFTNTSQAPSRFRPLLTQGAGGVRGAKTSSMHAASDSLYRSAASSDIYKSTQGSDIKSVSHHEQYRVAADPASKVMPTNHATVPIAYTSNVKSTGPTGVASNPGGGRPALDQARAAERMMPRQLSPEEAARSQNLAGTGMTAEQQQQQQTNRFRLSGLMFM
jgi:hypothetical protein